MAQGWRSGNERSPAPWPRRALRSSVDLLQADAAVDLRGAAHRGLRRMEAAARRRTADHRADGRRFRADARRFGRAKWRSGSPSRWKNCSGRSPAWSTSTPPPARVSRMAIVRFYVGQDEEKSIVRLNQKLSANFDLIPPGASQPLVKPRSIDDVPILALTFSSRRYGDFELRRIAAQLDDAIKQMPDVSAVTLIGGAAPGSPDRSGRRPNWRPINYRRLQVVGRARALQPTPAVRRVRLAATANTFWRPASSCALPKTFATSWPGVATTSRSSCATWPRSPMAARSRRQYVRMVGAASRSLCRR